MAMEERVEIGVDAGGQVADQIPQQGWIGSALDQRRQSAGVVERYDQRAGVARLVEKPSPTDGSKLFATVDQDRVLFSDRLWQPVSDRPPGMAAAPRDAHDRAGWLEPAGDRLEQGGFAAALGTDNGATPVE